MAKERIGDKAEQPRPPNFQKAMNRTRLSAPDDFPRETEKIIRLSHAGSAGRYLQRPCEWGADG